MSSVTIPVANHPKGYPVPIEEAISNKSGFYLCPECGEFLNPRKGTVYTHHYAHAPGVLDNNNCPLATEAGVEEVLDRHRTTPQEKAENARRFHLVLAETPGSVLELYGVVQSLDWDDVDDFSTLDADLEQIMINTAGVETDPVPTDFHPSEPEVHFTLDPDASGTSTGFKEYALAVSAADVFSTIHGAWSADYLESGAVFIGERTDAEHVTSTVHSPGGKWAYIILEDAPTGLPDHVNEYSLGKWTVLGFTVDNETIEILKEHGDTDIRDKNGFKANIVLPPYVPPNTKSAIVESPGTEVLIGVRPPETLDPTYEVVTVPKNKGQHTTIEPTGTGSPRLHVETVPEKGSRRVSVHQTGTNRHRLIHLHAASNNQHQTKQSGKSRELEIAVDTESSHTTLNPLGKNKFEFDASVDTNKLPDFLSFKGPSGYRLSIEGERTEDGVTETSRREGVTFDEFIEELPMWVEQGYRDVHFLFDALGRVSISVLDTDPWTTELSFSEVKQRIRDLDEFPKKSSWKLVRKVYRAPKGTRHNELPNSVKKQVRHAHKEIREERKS